LKLEKFHALQPRMLSAKSSELRIRDTAAVSASKMLACATENPAPVSGNAARQAAVSALLAERPAALGKARQIA
jgi:hypothetical protein